MYRREIRCKGCTQQLPNLKRLGLDNSDKIDILRLNYGDKPSSIETYLSKHHIKWKNGLANEEIMEVLRIDGFPNYLLLDPTGTIIIMKGTIEEIEKRL